MWFRSLSLLLIIEFCVHRPTLSDIICKDSRIDAMTYANDQQKYFFTSGGYYWWIPKEEFPPKDSAAKKLPDPFKIGHAAVYVDSENGCSSALTADDYKGVAIKEKVVWVVELVGTKQKLMAYDTVKDDWRPAIDYDADRCISRAKIPWSSGKSVDAMFVRNYLNIFVVMGNDYAMVDCKFVCTSASGGFGDGKNPSTISDFGTTDKLYATFIERDKTLYLFHEKYFFKVTINGDSNDGKLKGTKGDQEALIIQDFLTIAEPGECSSGQVPEENPAQDNPAGGEGEGENNDPSGGGGGEPGGSDFPWLIVMIVVIVVMVVVIGAVGFLAMKKKKPGQDKEAAKGKPGATPAGQVSAKAPPPKSPANAGATRTPSGRGKPLSTVTNKSNTDLTGVASKTVVAPKSAAPKSSVKK